MVYFVLHEAEAGEIKSGVQAATDGDMWSLVKSLEEAHAYAYNMADPEAGPELIYVFAPVLTLRTPARKRVPECELPGFPVVDAVDDDFTAMVVNARALGLPEPVKAPAKKKKGSEQK